MSVENTHYGAIAIENMLKDARSIYFIGIGGINMSSLAHLTHNMGYRTGGSDRTRTELTERLEERGISVSYSHSRERAQSYDAFVYTVAISADNPEYSYAREVGKPCISRADYLGYIMTFSERRLGIAGMHGKSTCSAMCASVYLAANTDPTVVLGAPCAAVGGYYRVGQGKDFIFEACEYRDSFLDFNPTTAVILNVELEHVDYFTGIEHVRASYGNFAALTGEGGCVICNADDADCMLSVKDYRGKTVTFGVISDDAFYRAVNIVYREGYPEFDVTRAGEHFCHVRLRVPGSYNIYNALATVAAADHDGISARDIEAGLAAFSGAGRRMEYKGKINGGKIYDDYGHHPTEIRATLAGARCLAGERSLVCVFQPHTYSRTATLFEDFALALSLADRVLLVPIYAARETDTLGVSSEKLARRIGERAVSCDSLESAAEILQRETDENVFTVVMGAGSVDKIYGIVKFDTEEK